MGRQRWMCIAGVALALCGCPSKPPPPNAGPMTPAKPAPSAAELQAWGHAAFGLIENHKFAEADAELQKILDARPNDLFAVQNRAVVRVLVLEGLDAVRDPVRFDAARQAARQAVARLQEVDSRSATAPLLAARIAKHSGDSAARIAALRVAVQLEPLNAAGWWELYQALGGGHLEPTAEDAVRNELLSAGRKVYALQPDNWFFLKDWMLDLATARLPELQAVLEQFQPQIEPFAAVIERDTRANPITYLKQALQSLADEQWNAALRSVRILGNIIKPEVPFDASRVEKTAFDYLRTDFDAAFDRDMGRPAPPATAAIPVAFQRQETAFPELPGGDVLRLAWVDYNVDGRNDLVVLTASHLAALTVDDSGRWQIDTALEVGEGFHTLLVADLDDDDPPSGASRAASDITSHLADPDVVLAGSAGILLLENHLAADGERQFVPRRDGVPWSDVRDVTAAMLADLDHDGDLDLFTATAAGVRLWAQRGQFQFFEITERSLLPPADAAVTAVALIDWDRDADADLLLSTSAGLRLLENARHGRFRDRSLEGPLVELPPANVLRVGDFDGNGAFDVLAAGDRGVQVVWMQPPLDGGPAGVLRIEELFRRPALDARAWDYDNDGFVDLIVESERGARTFRQESPTEFQPVELLPQEFAGPVIAADVDADGDLDLLAGAVPSVWRNDGGNAHHWIDVHIRALQEKGSSLANSKRVNHQGIGSLLELRAGGRYQAALVDSQSTHFGLGATERADLLRIVWTNGIPQNVLSPAANSTLFEEQLPIGSCPYLYTWNGERFVFCTDLLWNAPLGLRFAEDVIAPWREWEYIKIDGRNLQPRDGQYVLQITEELWEVAYFDQVQLVAVDHPAEVQVFTNEKVGPAELATPQLHTVRAPRRPIAARDTQGRDILSLVTSADGQYARTWDRKVASGLVSDHFLELDLGDLAGAQHIVLFLTGWMYPTDTSLNVQFSQHPTLPRPRPPALWTPNDAGQWQEARPFMGFIGGKPKTIAVDVSDAFAGGDYRLRIVTNMEFYWDDVFFTVDEPPATMVEHELPLLSADLHFRGCSQAVHRPGYGPEEYDYDAVSREPRWPPLHGALTRYGDVLPLLTTRDDRLAVFGEGDELTVSFAVPEEPLPAGWVRDFVLYSVGWDKDANLNTVHGHAVEPLPFEAMTAYGEERPADPDYDRYRNEYQTRRQRPHRFWNLLRQPAPVEGLLPRSRFETR